MSETLVPERVEARLSASTLVFEDVTKEFGWVPVLRGVSLRIEEGEYVALMGANGAGKTTLLRIAAGLAAPTSGSVTLAGVDLRRAGPGLRRRIGFVSHESLLYPDLTGRENLEFHARLFGVADPQGAIATLSDLLELDPILDRKAGILSRGNRQRLTLARALLHGPRVLLLDEPFTGLDEDSTARLLDLLDRVVATGRTVIMTTHDRVIAESGPRRLVFLGDGVVSDDRPLPVRSPAAMDEAETAFTRPRLESPPGRLAATVAVAVKDLRVEFRTRDVIGSAGLFALAVLITASFTMPTGSASTGASTGVLWISILFAVLLGVGRTMARESADRGIEGMLLSPIPRDAVFLGKLVASLVLMAAVEVVIIPLFLVMMTADAQGARPVALVGTVALGTLGLVTVASLFSGIAVGSRLGESMLPLLVMPVVIPLMVGAVELTGQALGQGDGSAMWQWLGILAGFDVMVMVAAVAMFRYVIEE